MIRWANGTVSLVSSMHWIQYIHIQGAHPHTAWSCWARLLYPTFLSMDIILLPRSWRTCDIFVSKSIMQTWCILYICSRSTNYHVYIGFQNFLKFNFGTVCSACTKIINNNISLYYYTTRHWIVYHGQRCAK